MNQEPVPQAPTPTGQPYQPSQSTHDDGLHPSADFVVEQQAAAAAAASLSGNSNLQSIYPQAAPTPHQWPDKAVPEQPLHHQEPRRSAHVLYDTLAIIFSIAGVAGPVLISILHRAEGVWEMAVVGVTLSAVAIFFAFQSYRRCGSVTPLSVIGLSGATMAMLSMVIMLLQHFIIQLMY